jgi:Hsp20/alpha crystallin family
MRAPVPRLVEDVGDWFETGLASLGGSPDPGGGASGRGHVRAAGRAARCGPEHDVKVNVDRGVLTVEAERFVHKRDKHRTEFRYGPLRRSVKLPDPADEERSTPDTTRASWRSRCRYVGRSQRDASFRSSRRTDSAHHLESARTRGDGVPVFMRRRLGSDRRRGRCRTHRIIGSCGPTVLRSVYWPHWTERHRRDDTDRCSGIRPVPVALAGSECKWRVGRRQPLARLPRNGPCSAAQLRPPPTTPPLSAG